MNKQSIVKKVSLAIVSLGLVAILFSSCHRSSGCPGAITYEIEAPADQDC